MPAINRRFSASSAVRYLSRTVNGAFEARVRALADAHDLLTERNWDVVSVGEMVERALHLFTNIHPGRISFSGPDAEFPAAKALLVAMTLHELATNAVKYGALSNDKGRVEIRWEMIRAGGMECLHLAWAEQDGPPVAAPSHRGFGSRMVERALRAQKGDAAIDFRPEGVRCEIRIPL